jgi:hypothetical protein
MVVFGLVLRVMSILWPLPFVDRRWRLNTLAGLVYPDVWCAVQQRFEGSPPSHGICARSFPRWSRAWCDRFPNRSRDDTPRACVRGVTSE